DMKRILFILMAFSFTNAYSQDKGFGHERVNSEKPTVYLEYVCQSSEKIYLRLMNNTIWHIGISTEKSYWPTKKPITLGNGNKGYAIPNGEEVEMFYYAE